MKVQAGPVPFERLKAESFVRGVSTLAVFCEDPFDDVAMRLEARIEAEGMRVVHVHRLDDMVTGHGLGKDLRCRVYEIFDPLLAAQLLAEDPGLAHLLPLRIAMHRRAGITTVTTPMARVLMSEFSHAASVAKLARRFEFQLQRVLRGLK